ncbi:hypothetical protein [Phreatobacter stygius]|uniref:Uncharacterized protein n=1 Tax=Phreatobacter stygius TaxID=1940610 RepID=A0A4D7B367_9HYPH|nr:hypothetical protein [Phreatobacter stygius]QCI64026.1 hypothetical protein E8M01_07065 [Phreatobacter stygius]
MTVTVMPMASVVPVMPMTIGFAAGENCAENHRDRRQFQSMHVMSPADAGAGNAGPATLHRHCAVSGHGRGGPACDTAPPAVALGEGHPNDLEAWPGSQNP